MLRYRRQIAMHTLRGIGLQKAHTYHQATNTIGLYINNTHTLNHTYLTSEINTPFMCERFESTELRQTY